MNKQQYLSELSNRLKGIPKEDRDDALNYYEELMGDMELSDNEDVTLRLGTPKEVAREIIDNTTVKYVEEASTSKKKVKSTGTVIWLTILGILSAPVSLPLAIVAFAIVLTLVITLLVIYLSLFATAIALVGGGLFTVGMALFAPGFMSKIAWIGAGLVAVGLGILLGFGLIVLIRLIVSGIGHKKSAKREN